MGVILYEKLGSYLIKLLPGIKKVIVLNKECIIIIEKEWLKIIMQILKTNVSFCMLGLQDIWCTDYPERSERFELNYLLVSFKYNFRVMLRLTLQDSWSVETVSDIFGSAGWLEREVWDMNGIFFYNNTDLRRILTDYGFEGFPLRKDFPLSGFVEVRYDDTEKRIVQELLEISQEYRNFNFKSPWEKL